MPQTTRAGLRTRTVPSPGRTAAGRTAAGKIRIRASGRLPRGSPSREHPQSRRLSRNPGLPTGRMTRASRTPRRIARRQDDSPKITPSRTSRSGTKAPADSETMPTTSGSSTWARDGRCRPSRMRPRLRSRAPPEPGRVDRGSATATRTRRPAGAGPAPSGLVPAGTTAGPRRPICGLGGMGCADPGLGQPAAAGPPAEADLGFSGPAPAGRHGRTDPGYDWRAAPEAPRHAPAEAPRHAPPDAAGWADGPDAPGYAPPQGGGRPRGWRAGPVPAAPGYAPSEAPGWADGLDASGYVPPEAPGWSDAPEVPRHAPSGVPGWADAPDASGYVPPEAPGWADRRDAPGYAPPEVAGWSAVSAAPGYAPSEAPGWADAPDASGYVPPEAPGWSDAPEAPRHAPSEVPGWADAPAARRRGTRRRRCRAGPQRRSRPSTHPRMRRAGPRQPASRSRLAGPQTLTRNMARLGLLIPALAVSRPWDQTPGAAAVQARATSGPVPAAATGPETHVVRAERRPSGPGTSRPAAASRSAHGPAA